MKRLFPKAKFQLFDVPVTVTASRFTFRGTGLFIKQIFKSVVGPHSSLNSMDTDFLILFTIATGLRLAEILSLKQVDLKLIQAGQVVSVRSKTMSARLIPTNKLLTSLITLYLSEHMMDTRQNFITNAMIKARTTAFITKRTGYFIASSESGLNRTLKLKWQTFINTMDLTLGEFEKVNGMSVGFNLFRRYTTTQLADQSIDLAAVYNAHKQIDTTVRHYINQDNESLNRLQSSMKAGIMGDKSNIVLNPARR